MITALIFTTALMAFGMWAMINHAAGRFNKSYYTFKQYGMKFKLVKYYGSLTIIHLGRFKTTNVGSIPSYSHYSIEEMKQKAHEEVESNYQWEKEEWESKQ